MAGAGFACVCELPLVTAALTAAAGAVGGVIPDLDHRKSTITKKLGLLGFFSSRLFRHRGILHAPMFHCILAAILLLFVNSENYVQFVIFGILAGTLSHLFLDALTPMGIPMLWPFSGRHISLLPISTDGSIDHFIGRISLIASVCVLGYIAVFHLH